LSRDDGRTTMVFERSLQCNNEKPPPPHTALWWKLSGPRASFRGAVTAALPWCAALNQRRRSAVSGRGGRRWI